MNQESGIKEKKVSKPVIASEFTLKKTEGKQSQDLTAVKTGTASSQVPRSDKKAKKALESSLTIEVMDVKGGKKTMTLPQAVFAAKVNKPLMAQAVRVYLANQRMGTAKTKSRGEVQGSTRKIYRQKGTGRARHGSIRAPIFVHGGVVFGPVPHDYSLNLPKKMKKQALFSALTSKRMDGVIKVVSGLDSIEGKTKVMADILKKLAISSKNQTLLVLSAKSENVHRTARNIKRIVIMPISQLNTYDVLKSTTIVFMQQAVEALAQK